MEESDEIKVIQMKPDSGGVNPGLTFTLTKTNFCAHQTIEIDTDERELRCQRCNAVVEPYDFVMSLAKEEARHFLNLKQIKNDITYLNQQKEKLIREVANIKAQKRRLA